MEELRLEVLLEPERTGGSVAEICLRHGISRASFYRYRRRYLEDGFEGLESRSRRPRHSPLKIAPALEAEICELRRRHPRWGARRIRAELRRAGVTPPATSTIHQALQRNHLVAPQPARKPQARRRFEREVPNDLWQIDATEVRLASGEKAWVVDCLDDHARFCLSARAGASPTGEACWGCFTSAAAAYGLPRQLLSDNQLSFTGRLYPPRSVVRAVASNGVFAYGGRHINIGVRFAGARVAIVEQGELVHVYYGDELVRSLAPDPHRRYQRLDKRRGRRFVEQGD